jgi:hypothetical protein
MDATWRRLSPLDRGVKRGKRQANVDRAGHCIADQPTQLSPVARIYAREEHHDDRREALEAWAKHLTAPPATVSDLKQKRVRGALR